MLKRSDNLILKLYKLKTWLMNLFNIKKITIRTLLWSEMDLLLHMTCWIIYQKNQLRNQLQIGNQNSNFLKIRFDTSRLN